MLGCGEDAPERDGPAAGEPTETERVSRYSPDDPEYKLATLDLDREPTADAEVAPYARLIGRARRHCPRDRQIRIADMTVRAQELLADAGIDESLRAVLSNVVKSMPTGTRRLLDGRCADVFASYVTLRKQG